MTNQKDESDADANDCVRGVVMHQSAEVVAEDLDGLPEELIKQLDLNDSRILELNIIKAMQIVGGKATINKTLISIYHLTGEIYDKSQIGSKMYRMVQSGKISNDVDGKGVYAVIDT